MKTRIAIACQGGGSQAAFTAGALQGLIEAGIADEFEIVALTGTSGGALCAALVWYAIKRGDGSAAQRLADLWSDNTARGFTERLYNDAMIQSMRMANSGIVPTFATSPSSPWTQSAVALAGIGQRREYTDLEYLLRRHIDFERTAQWGVQPEPPVLILGAANVLSGQLIKFNSAQQPIRVEHILASCCVPNIFPAVEIDGQAYWDGLFSDNPPLDDLIAPAAVGSGNIPHEIWLIKINPTHTDRVPVRSDDIIDRRNQLEGNLSIKQNLKYIELLNDQLIAGAFNDAFLKRLDVQRPVRIPKAFAQDPDKPYHIPFIEMSEALQKDLDYEGKLDRSERAIQTLMQDGRSRAQQFLAARKAA